MKKIATTLTTLFVALMTLTGIAAAQGQYVSGTTGVDLSWPNCRTSVSKVTFGIVGVSDGTSYSDNPCVASEASHFSNLSFYVNTGWYSASSNINPSSPKLCVAGDENCLAYNYGYDAGLYALNYANSQNIHSATWWLDVETSNTWANDTTQNRNSLQGEYDALAANGVSTVGVYSTTAQWDAITGSWLNNWPSWGATTWTTAKQAKTYCTGHQFTGGPSYLMQYTPRRSSLDQDVAC